MKSLYITILIIFAFLHTLYASSDDLSNRCILQAINDGYLAYNEQPVKAAHYVCRDAEGFITNSIIDLNTNTFLYNIGAIGNKYYYGEE